MLPVNACNAMAPSNLVECASSLLLHLADKVLSRDGELVCDDVAHVHQILQPLLQYLIHADVVWNCQPTIMSH